MKFKILFTIVLSSSLVFSCGYAEKQRKKYEEAQKEAKNVRKKYDKNGKLLSEFPLKEGKKHGVGKNYYKNGKVHSEITYENGIKQGIAKWYYKSGKLYRESNFVEGKLDGLRKVYYESGELKAEIPYKKGELQMGTKEFKSSGERLESPKLVFKLDDNIALNNKAYLYVSVSNKIKKVEFYQEKFNEIKQEKIKVYLSEENGVGNIEFYVPRGSFMMEKLIFHAKLKSKYGNEMIIKGTYNLALEN